MSPGSGNEALKPALAASPPSWDRRPGLLHVQPQGDPSPKPRPGTWQGSKVGPALRSRTTRFFKKGQFVYSRPLWKTTASVPVSGREHGPVTPARICSRAPRATASRALPRARDRAPGAHTWGSPPGPGHPPSPLPAPGRRLAPPAPLLPRAPARRAHLPPGSAPRQAQPIPASRIAQAAQRRPEGSIPAPSPLPSPPVLGPPSIRGGGGGGPRGEAGPLRPAAPGGGRRQSAPRARGWGCAWGEPLSRSVRRLPVGERAVSRGQREAAPGRGHGCDSSAPAPPGSGGACGAVRARLRPQITSRAQGWPGAVERTARPQGWPPGPCGCLKPRVVPNPVKTMFFPRNTYLGSSLVFRG